MPQPQAVFYDKDSNVIPEDRVAEALSRGEANVRQGQKVFIEQDGNVVAVEPHQVQQFMEQGWGVSRAATVQDQQDRLEAQRSPVTATGEALVRGATLGLSDKAGEVLLGDEYAKRAQLRAEENPNLATGGELVGAIAPAFASGGSTAGAGLGRTLLANTPAGLLARSSMAAGERLGAGIAARGGSQMVARGANYGAAGALEGAGAQMAQNVGELDDEPLTTEKLFAGVGSNALLGGALGSFVGAGLGRRADSLGRKGTQGHIAPEIARLTDADAAAVMRAPTEAWSPIPDWASSALSKASSKVTGESPANLKRVLSDADIGARLQVREQVLPELGRKMRTDLDEVSNLKALTKELSERPTVADDVRSLVPSGREAEIRAQAQQLLEQTGGSVRDQFVGSARLKKAQGMIDFVGKELGGAPDPIKLSTALKQWGDPQWAELAKKMGQKKPPSLETRNAVLEALGTGNVGEALADKGTRLPAAANDLLRNHQKRLQQAFSQEPAEMRAALENLHRDAVRLRDAHAPNPAASTERIAEAAAVRDVAEEQVKRLESALGSEIWGDAATSWQARSAKSDTVTESGKKFRRALNDPDMFLRGVNEGDGSIETIVQHLQNEQATAETLLQSGRATAAQREAIEKSKAAAERLLADVNFHGPRAAEENMLQGILNREQSGGDPVVSSLAGFALGGLPGAVAGGAIKSAWGAISQPGTLARKIGVAKLLKDRVWNNVDNKIAKAVRSQLSGAVARKASDLVPEAPRRALGAGGLYRRAAVAAFGANREERRTTYEKKIESIKMMERDPGLQQRYLSQVVTRGLADTHPGLVIQAGMIQARAVQFITSKLPPQPAPNPLQPQLTKPYVSESEIDRMSKYMTAVEKPMTVIEDWQNGVVSAESVEALKAVYPKLYEQLGKEVQTQLLKTTKPLPYNEQLQVSILLGLPGNYFQQPDFLHRQAERFARVNQRSAEASQRGPKPSATSQRAAAESSMTQSEKLETRL